MMMKQILQILSILINNKKLNIEFWEYVHFQKMDNIQLIVDIKKKIYGIHLMILFVHNVIKMIFIKEILIYYYLKEYLIINLKAKL